MALRKHFVDEITSLSFSREKQALGVDTLILSGGSDGRRIRNRSERESSGFSRRVNNILEAAELLFALGEEIKIKERAYRSLPSLSEFLEAHEREIDLIQLLQDIKNKIYTTVYHRTHPKVTVPV